MPTLSQLQDTTTPIQFTRGAISFTFNAALEKMALEKKPGFMPSEGTTYAELLRAETEITKKAALLRIELNQRAGELSEAANPDNIRARVAQMRGIEGEQEIAAIDLSEASNSEVQAAFDHLASGIEEGINSIEKRIDANDKARLFNYAKRLAYLVVSTDLGPDEAGRALHNGVNKTPEEWMHNAKLFFECFTAQLLRGCLEEVEGAVYGPLVTSGS